MGFLFYRRRQGLIENCLRESQGATPSTMARIFVNRHLAAEHLVDPTHDPEAKNSIFNQVNIALGDFLTSNYLNFSEM